MSSPTSDPLWIFGINLNFFLYLFFYYFLFLLVWEWWLENGRSLNDENKLKVLHHRSTCSVNSRFQCYWQHNITMEINEWIEPTDELIKKMVEHMLGFFFYKWGSVVHEIMWVTVVLLIWWLGASCKHRWGMLEGVVWMRLLNIYLLNVWSLGGFGWRCWVGFASKLC